MKYQNQNRRLTKGKSWVYGYRPKGRANKANNFSDVTNYSGYLWEHGKWVHKDVAVGVTIPWASCYVKSDTMHGVHSVKAFRRRLRQWSMYLPPGVEFVLVSNFKGFDVTGRTK